MRVAVIGAGLAGLYCAQQLKDKNHNVTVFEKSRGRGGRMAVKRLDWGTLDIGAQYFTARDSGFCDQVTKWVELGLVKQWKFTPHVYRQQTLTASPDDVERYVGCPTMNAPAKHLASQVDVQLNTRIEQIKFNQGMWQLKDDHGEFLGYYDWLVIAIPAEQCKTLLHNKVDLAEKISIPVHSPCWALALATRGNVAPEIQGIFADENVSWVSRVSSKPSRQKPKYAEDTWMLHFSEQASASINAGELKNKGSQWLNNALDQELEVVQHYQHFWRYARVSDDHQESQPSQVLSDEHQRISVIGDWTQGGRVEGAFLSAQHLVQQLHI